MNRKGQTTLIVVLIVLFVIILAVPAFFGVPIETTRGGTHTGYVTAVEENGMIWHKYTVYFKTDAQSSQEDMYCLKDLSLVETLRNKEQNKEKVTITYNSYFSNGLINCDFDTSAIITGVK